MLSSILSLFRIVLIKPVVFVLWIVYVVLRFLLPYVLPTAIGFGIAFHYVFRAKRKALERVAGHTLSVIDRAGLEELLKAGIKADDLMASLPAWVRYPEFERVTWINTFIRGLWPYLDKAVCEEIRTQADPILKENCPPFLKSISFKELRIGREHLPQITGIKVLKEGEEITIQVKISWAGDPKIVIAIETPAALTMTVGLEDLHVFAHPRILLKPLVNKIPCFSAMSISLMEAPKVDYKLNAFGLPITSVPGLADFLEGFVSKLLCDMLLWPKRMVVPVIKDEEGNILEDPGDLEKRPVGTLFIKLIKADSLKPPSLELGRLMSAMEVFVMFRLSANRKVKSKAKVSTKKADPLWNETFQVLVESPETEVLEVEVYAKDSLATKAAKVGSSSEGTLLGYTSLALKHMGNNKKIERVFKLTDRKSTTGDNFREGGLLFGTTKTLTGGAGKIIGGASKGFKKATGGGSNSSVAKEVDRGNLEFAVLYRPFRHNSSIRSKTMANKAVADADAAVAAQNGAPVDSNGADITSEEEEDNEDFKHFCSTIHGGSLHVKIVKAMELSAVTANPYVTFTFGPFKHKTEVQKNSLNPVFNFHESINVNTDELLTQDLCFEVKSQHSIKANSSLGKVVVPLKEVIKEGRMQDLLTLKDVRSGKIEVDLTWTGY